MESKTTKLLKGCKEFITCHGGYDWYCGCAEKSILNFPKNKVTLCSKCKSELKGRLDALKEEIKYLREFQKILNNNCIYQIEDRLESIQEEIKLIEEKI